MTTASPFTEIRTDVLTKRQVIVAAQRSHRPVAVTADSSSDESSEDPFLQGNETSTPHERLALRRSDTAANSEGWLLRAVPNRYPAVNETVQPLSANDGLDSSSTALTGIHDVIIECPDGRTSLTQLSEAEVARILVAWQTRSRQIATGGQFRFVNVFRNEGFGAGASLPHCHSQLVASNLTTSVMEARLAAEKDHQSQRDNTLFQVWLQQELSDDIRIVKQTAPYVVLCPFASRFPWQVRICPAEARSFSFLSLSMPQLCELAAALLSVSDGLARIANNVAFNITLTVPPLDSPDAFPWMLDVLPRPSRFAGFELLTDIDILTVAPEQAAELYRDVVNWRTPCNEAEVCPPGFVWT